jgi:hypothetical protein
MAEHHFLNERSSNYVIGEIVARSTQPMSGVPIVRITVIDGPEKGMLYWVPAAQVHQDGVLGIFARL